MRDYRNFDYYLDKLYLDIYAQPDDEGHTDFARASIDWACKILSPGSVLDVGCGQGFCSDLFIEHGFSWSGVTLGEDFKVCWRKKLPVLREDMTFLSGNDNSVDYIFSRHSLEHSPFPVLTLMEWRRVSRGHLILIVPTPDFWGKGGKNHYAVYDKERWWYAFARSGWKPVHEKSLKTDENLFLKNYMPHIRNPREREKLKYPGPPVDVEWWYILEPIEEIRE